MTISHLHRRTLLRAGLLLPLAGCTPVARDAAAPSPAALPSVAPAPAPSPTAASPSLGPSPEPSPEPEPEAPPAPTGVVRTAIGRDTLGLPEPAPGGVAHTITGLMLHHTAAPTADASRAPDRFRGHARSHREAGFVDVAYHWGIDVDGNVYELRDEAIAGETFTDYDPAGWFLVVCEGNFEESQPTDAMLAAIADVFASGAERHGVDPSTLVGHRDRAATLCPGVSLQARLGELAEMVQARLDADGVTLEVTDDPTMLAAIEAG